jgi:hypothetical protein
VPVNPVAADAILKIDAVTGDVWILQMTINAPQDPRITLAEFIPVNYRIHQNHEYNNNNE